MSDDLVKKIEALGKLKQRLRLRGSPEFFYVKKQHKELKKKLSELTKDKAPELIVTSQCGKTLVHDGMKRFETDVEYIRADHVDALLKAEREKALRDAADTVQLGDTVQNIQRRILTLTVNPAG